MKRRGKLDSSTAECWRRSSYLRRTSSAARCPPARLSPTFAVRESRRDRCGEDTDAYSLPPGAGGRTAQRGRNQSRSRFPPFGRESCLLRDVLCRPRAARLTAARDVTTQRRDFAVRSALRQGRGSCRENSRNGCTTDSRIGKRQTTGSSSSTYLWKSSLFSRTLESSSRVYAGICSLAELTLKGCATSMSCSAGLQACITAAATLMSVLTRARAG